MGVHCSVLRYRVCGGHVCCGAGSKWVRCLLGMLLRICSLCFLSHIALSTFPITYTHISQLKMAQTEDDQYSWVKPQRDHMRKQYKAHGVTVLDKKNKMVSQSGRMDREWVSRVKWTCVWISAQLFPSCQTLDKIFHFSLSVNVLYVQILLLCQTKLTS